MKRLFSCFLVVVFCVAGSVFAKGAFAFPETIKSGDTHYAVFHVSGNKTEGYIATSLFGSPVLLMKIEAVEQGDENANAKPAMSILSDEDADLVLYSIYSQINLDDILQKVKDSDDEEKFNSVFGMLYLISEHVATVSDKRKIMDFFMEHFQLKLSPDEIRTKAKSVFDRQWVRFNIDRNPLISCLSLYTIEYTGQLLGIVNNQDLQRAVVHMLQNNIYLAPELRKAAAAPNVPAKLGILLYIYSQSVLGEEQKISVPATRLAELKKELGETHRGIRTAEIQDRILAGDLRPEFAAELREIIDKNYEIALPIAIDYSRKIGAWDDVAYYAYRCLKRDVYGIQKQLDRPSPYFDYLEFTLEGLAKTDPQAAGTLYEFIRALPKTTKQNLWLVRAERILNGVDYDKDLAKKDGATMAEKGFYENANLEARFHESFEKRLKK